MTPFRRKAFSQNQVLDRVYRHQIYLFYFPKTWAIISNTFVKWKTHPIIQYENTFWLSSIFSNLPRDSFLYCLKSEHQVWSFKHHSIILLLKKVFHLLAEDAKTFAKTCKLKVLRTKILASGESLICVWTEMMIFFQR